VDVEPVDPRDQSWEVDEPTYRVYFATPSGAVTDEHEITGADVRDVLAWVDANRGSRTCLVYVCVRSSEGLGLVRLEGSNPNVGRSFRR
jgi:hypothetical protein